MDANIYESRKLLDEYLLFHYGDVDAMRPFAQLPQEALNFPVRTVRELLPDAAGRALDVGCATGRSSFELARTCQEVMGIDFSESFIQAAQTLQQGGTLAYQRLEEGHVKSDCVATVPTDLPRDRVRFAVGDAMNLPADLGSWDVVHAANLICRLPNPEAFLHRMASMVRPGGRLALTTPCTWLGEFTPPENWPPGRTLDWLHDFLDPHFHCIATRDLPFLIRETARKFQLTNALGSVWVRKNE